MFLVLLSLAMTCIYFYEHKIPQGIMWIGLTMAWAYLLFEVITDNYNDEEDDE